MADLKRGASRRRRFRLSDILLGAAGLALGISCAWFPWYVFMHQDEFGFRGSNLGKVDAALATSRSGSAAPLYPDYIDSSINPNAALDQLSTGTTPGEGEPPPAPATADEQPFPGHEVDFRLVMVANGQAMIEDGASFWVVQQGSILPDNSSVAAIEQRDGRWVIVTSKDKVVELTGQ